MTIDEIKNHGAALGLEAEMNVRIATMKSAYTDKKWTTVFSCASYICQLAEELRKLNDKLKPNASQPLPKSD